jgi:hypothetical protein
LGMPEGAPGSVFCVAEGSFYFFGEGGSFDWGGWFLGGGGHLDSLQLDFGWG